MNLILNTDSYKASHFRQYPPATEKISSYIEARAGGRFSDIVFFGLQMFIKAYLNKPVTADDITEAEAMLVPHGLPFNRDGWQHIVDRHGGLLPLEIEALPEGSVVKAGIPLVQVVNTDPELYWLTSYVETALLRAVWYPTTIASLSHWVRQMIWRNLCATSDDPDAVIGSRLHDFGARGATSKEQTGIGGLAHLVSFEGTDTLEALIYGKRYYGCAVAGYSIPAAEHSTITSWGADREEDAYRNMIDAFARDGAMVSVVSDSYDLWYALDGLWGDRLRSAVLASGGTLIVRPDSGDPIKVPLQVMDRLGALFGTSTNSKGYKLLHPSVRVIQGDGMDPLSIQMLLDRMQLEGWSGDNIAFGMGGGLLQKVDRDTLRFAMKANARQDSTGHWHDVMKNPTTDPAKISKAGRQAVVREASGYAAIRLDALGDRDNCLRPVYRDGRLLVDETLDTIRARTRV